MTSTSTQGIEDIPVLPLASRAAGAAAARAILVDPHHAPDLDHLVRGFSEQVAIVDENWIIVSVNDGWKNMVKVAGYPELKPGTDYRLFLQTFAKKGHVTAAAVLAGVNAIDAGDSEFFQLTYGGVDDWEGRTLQLRINRLHIDGRALATIARQDITDTVELKSLREQFSSSVIKSQAEERARLARELHDSTTQYLTAINLLLGTLAAEPDPSKGAGLIKEIKGLVAEAQREVRSISYLIHAPVVEETGLLRALEALVTGFGRRAQFDVSFQVLGTPERVSPTIKNALYRIAQEALSNVHRHAKADHVRVWVVFRRSMIHLVVSDNGVGIPHETLAEKGLSGVGLAGMRSRLAQVGGRLSLRRLSPGTAIAATAPIA